MRVEGLLLAALLFGGTVGASPAWQPSHAQSRLGASAAPGVRVINARFWRTDATTLLEGTIGVPILPQAGDVVSPTVELIVRDNAGNILHEESWKQEVTPELAQIAARPGGAEVTSSFSVALQRGAYSVVVRTTGARVDSARIDVQSFTEQPLISDLLLSSAVRVLGPSDSAAAGELKRSVYAIARTPLVKLTPTQATLWYYVEAYAPEGAAADSATLDFSVTTPDGARVLLRSSRTFQLQGPGRPDAGKLDMTGLPPGEFRLVLNARAGARQATREAHFVMGTFDDEPPVPVASAAVARLDNAEDEMATRYLAAGTMADTSVVLLIESLALAPPGEAVSKEVPKMDVAAQRRFLARYFSRIDPTPGTPRNELFEEYVKRVEFANRNFSERDIGRSGVRTDRGRIYVKYGAPDDRMNRPMTRRGAVDVWRYTRQRNLKFVFLDDSGFEHFNLVSTNAPNERSQPNWRELVGDNEVLRVIDAF